MTNQEKLDYIIAEYIADNALYQKCAEKIQALLEEIMIEKSIKFHNVDHRIKTQIKIKKKIVDKNHKYGQLSEITDVAGVRIISLFEDDVDLIAEIIEEEFEIDWENSIDKRKFEEPDRFGYKSLHYVVSAHSSRKKLTEFKAIKDLKCEIQVRSILQHAWAEIEHDLGYKSKKEIPSESRRKFSRIASLLELADKEFIEVKNQLNEYKNQLQEKLSNPDEVVEINKISLQEYIANNTDLQRIENEIIKKIDTTFSTHPNSGLVGLGISKVFGIQTIKELSEVLIANEQQVKDFAVAVLSSVTPKEEIIRGISLLYLGYTLAYNSGDKEVFLNYLKESYLGRDNEYEENRARITALYNDFKDNN